MCAFSTITLQEFRTEINYFLLKNRVFNHKAKILKLTKIALVLDHFLCELREEEHGISMLQRKEVHT
jgi:hypothetical protein